jgi:hypothetical protein
MEKIINIKISYQYYINEALCYRDEDIKLYAAINRIIDCKFATKNLTIPGLYGSKHYIFSAFTYQQIWKNRNNELNINNKICDILTNIYNIADKLKYIDKEIKNTQINVFKTNLKLK